MPIATRLSHDERGHEIFQALILVAVSALILLGLRAMGTGWAGKTSDISLALMEVADPDAFVPPLDDFSPPEAAPGSPAKPNPPQAGPEPSDSENDQPTTETSHLEKYRFTFDQEVGSGPNESRRPHFPGGVSGITLGAGYDMGRRDKDTIVEQLQRIGIEEKLAEEIATAAKIKGQEAANEWLANWRKQHGQELVMTREQEEKLFEFVAPEYETTVQNRVTREFGPEKWDTLSKDQKAMLFDLEYNRGGVDQTAFTKAVVNKEWKTVSTMHRRYSNGKPLGRNEAFARTFGHLWNNLEP